MSSFQFLTLCLLTTQGALCYVVGPLATLEHPSTSKEIPPPQGSATPPCGALLKTLLPLMTRLTRTVLYPTEPTGSLLARPQRMRLTSHTQAQEHKPDQSAVVFPGSDDVADSSAGLQQDTWTRSGVDESYFTGNNYPVLSDDYPVTPDDYPVTPDDSITFDGPTSSREGNRGGRPRPQYHMFPNWEGNAGRRPGVVNVPSWQGNDEERPNVPNWQGNGGVRQNPPSWPGNGGVRPNSPSSQGNGDGRPNFPGSQGNGVGRPTTSSWQENGGRPEVTSEESESTTPECDCPVSSEFNPVCGEIGEERQTFTNMNELKCASFCTQSQIRVIFHSSCIGVTSNRLYPVHHFTTPPSPPSAHLEGSDT